MKIYVGNLSYRTSDDGLRAAFEQFGTVSSVDIIQDRETGRSKGFGFVEMPDNAEGQKAIEAMDNNELDERTLKVNEARPREPRPSGGGGYGGGGGGGRRFDRGPRRDY